MLSKTNSANDPCLLNQTGNILRHKGHDSQAVKYFLMSIKNSEEHSDHYLTAVINLAACYLELGEYESAVEYLEKSAKVVLFFFGHQSQYYLIFLRAIANTYYQCGEFHKFIRCGD